MDCTYYIDDACNNSAVRGIRCVGARCKQRVSMYPDPPEAPPKRIIKEDVEIFPNWLKQLFRSH